MANDRLFLICDICGEELQLAKYYPTQLFYVNPHLGPTLQRFLDKHHACRTGRFGKKPGFDGQLHNGNTLDGYTGFFLQAESEKGSEPIGTLPLDLGVKDGS